MVLGPRERAAEIQNRIRTPREEETTSSSAAAAAQTSGATSSSSSNPAVFRNYDATQIRNLYGDLSLTNLYEVNFSSLPPKLKGHLALYNLDTSWLSTNLGLLCTDATLPTSSFATAEVKDNYIGVTQEFAHTRLYTDIDLTFYVDANYNALQFFELWMDYISGAGISLLKDSRQFFRRMNYPDNYKVDTMSIIKFDKGVLDWSNKKNIDYKYVLKYDFINLFPKSITSIPVNYGSAELLKVTVTFNYDRYNVSRTEQRPQQSSEQRSIATSSTSSAVTQSSSLEPKTAEELTPAQRQAQSFRSTIGDRKFKSQAARDILSKY